MLPQERTEQNRTMWTCISFKKNPVCQCKTTCLWHVWLFILLCVFLKSCTSEELVLQSVLLIHSHEVEQQCFGSNSSLTSVLRWVWEQLTFLQSLETKLRHFTPRTLLQVADPDPFWRFCSSIAELQVSLGRLVRPLLQVRARKWYRNVNEHAL